MPLCAYIWNTRLHPVPNVLAWIASDMPVTLSLLHGSYINSLQRKAPCSLPWVLLVTVRVAVGLGIPLKLPVREGLAEKDRLGRRDGVAEAESDGDPEEVRERDGVKPLH